MKTRVISSARRITMLGVGLLIAAAMPAAALLLATATPAATVSNGLISFTSIGRSNGGGITSMQNQIYTMDETGNGVTPLTTRPSKQSKWSPDGSQLIYVNTRLVMGNTPSSRIFRINADGTGDTDLTALIPNAGTINKTPAWSTDGNRIAFTSNRDDPLGDIYTVSATGGAALRWTYLASGDKSPAFSPLGNRLVFISDRNDGNGDIFSLYLNTGGVFPFFGVDGNREATPAFSPDGTRIAYAAKRNGNMDIYTIAADGTGTELRLTTNAATDTAPAFSPDGSKIAFVSRRDSGNREIYVMNSYDDGTNADEVNISNSPGTEEVTPSWQPIIDTTPPDQPPQPTPQPAPLATPSYSEPCTVGITTPRLKKATRWRSKKSRKSTTVKVSRRAMKSILARHGVKGIIKDGIVNGKQAKCTGLSVLLLKKSRPGYTLPGIGTKVSSKRLRPTRFKKTARWLKRKYRGAVRLRTKRTDNGTKFSYKTFNRKSKAGRRALNRLKKRNHRGTYSFFYTAKVSGKTIQREIVLKTGKSK